MNALFTPIAAFFDQPQWDLLLVIGFVCTYLAYSFFFARFKMMIATVAIFCAYTCLSVTPWLTSFLTSGSLFDQTLKTVGVFLGLFVGASVLLERSSLGDAMVGRGGYLSVLLLGLCQAGFLVTLILSFLPSSAVTAWASPAIEFTFLHDTARSLWAISSVASLAAFGRGLV